MNSGPGVKIAFTVGHTTAAANKIVWESFMMDFGGVFLLSLLGSAQIVGLWLRVLMMERAMFGKMQMRLENAVPGGFIYSIHAEELARLQRFGQDGFVLTCSWRCCICSSITHILRSIGIG